MHIYTHTHTHTHRCKIITTRRKACKESSDETESIAIIFSAEIKLLWRLNQVWVSIKLYNIYIYIYNIHHKEVTKVDMTLNKETKPNHKEVHSKQFFFL